MIFWQNLSWQNFKQLTVGEKIAISLGLWEHFVNGPLVGLSKLASPALVSEETIQLAAQELLAGE